MERMELVWNVEQESITTSRCLTSSKTARQTLFKSRLGLKLVISIHMRLHFSCYIFSCQFATIRIRHSAYVVGSYNLHWHVQFQVICMEFTCTFVVIENLNNVVDEKTQIKADPVHYPVPHRYTV